MNTKRQKWSIGIAAGLLLVGSLAGCKSSGVAVTSGGQVIHVDIEVPTDLSEGETKELTVSVGNRGVSGMKNVVFEVELPAELVVLSTVPEEGLNGTEMTSPSGNKMFVYRSANIQAMTTDTVRFHVKAAFGAMEKSGDIRVTAWSEDLPGDKLVETKFIKLRR